MPLVTVLIPAYNAAAYIRQAVESVLGQTERDLEVIVVDDCSTDGTAEIVGSIARSDERVRLIRNEQNKGTSASRNAALDAAHGQWIAPLDADDWFDEVRLDFLIGLAEKHGADIVADNQFITQGHSSQPFRTLFSRRGIEPKFISVQEFLRRDMAGNHGGIGLLKPVIKRSFLEANGIRYRKGVGVVEDFLLLMECYAKSATLLLCPSPHYYYRRHDSSSISNVKLNDLTKAIDVNNRFIAVFSAPLDHRIRALLRKRARSMEIDIRYRAVTSAMRTGEWKRVVQLCVRDPGILAALVFGLARSAVWRLGRWRVYRRSEMP